MENINKNQFEGQNLILLVNQFFEQSPVPSIELLNKFFFQTEDNSEKQELLRLSKLILNLYEGVISNINDKELNGDNITA